MDGVGKAHIYTQPNQCRAQGTAIVYPDKKIAPVISHKGFIRLDYLAPRPGLEPGTYGLTVEIIFIYQ
jgi:hypothetical protein